MRALDPRTSFIVQAPAGSGKTELLIQRYLKLLSVVEEPEEIAAITFTKKAAAEMRARVVQALQRAAAPRTAAATGQASLFGGAAAVAEEPLAPHERITHELARAALARDRAREWGLLENPARMRIGTIDALSASITRRMPWTSRFGAFPAITEKADPLYREAARRTIRLIEITGRPSQAVRTLLLHLDNDTGQAEQLIVEMLERRDQWLRLVGSGDMDMARVRAQLEGQLAAIVNPHLDRLRALFPEDLLEQAVDLARHAGAVIDFDPDDWQSWKSLAGFLLTEGKKVRQRASKNMGFRKRECESLFRAVDNIQPLSEALCELRNLPSPAFTGEQWRVLEAIVLLLPYAVAELREVFGEREQVDFAELTLSANRALEAEGEPTDLALSLGCRIRHILVDEFQDTSQSQWGLLRKLTRAWEPADGNTLFLVGDPMQSIYRFREAEVGLFLRAWEEGFGGIPLEPLTLSVNFRSTPAIVDWVNSAFSEILPRESNVATGAVPYTASVSGADASQAPGPRIHAFIGDAGHDEAERVLRILRDSSQNRAHRARPTSRSASSGGTPPRPVRSAGRTAILVRARRHLAAIVPRLKREGIPFQAVEIDQLAELAIVQDLMALTFTLLHPADRVSRLAVLRAPWCGLTLADLLVLDTPERVSADGAARLARVRPILDRAIAERGRRRLRELVELAWIAFGGPACIERASDLEDAAAYFDLLEELDEGGDLSSFGELRERVADLFARPDTRASDALQVMTIHKAKGLEFDTVIVPGLGSPPQPDRGGLLLWHELAEGGLLIAPLSATRSDRDPVYHYLNHLERQKTKNENARLLYVAATRARRDLHLLGYVSRPGGKPSEGSFLKLLWEMPVVQQAFDDAVAPPPVLAGAPCQPRSIQRLPLEWRAPDPPPDVKWTPAAPPLAVEPPITYEWVGDTLKHVGSVVHDCAQRIAHEGLDHWPPERIRSSRIRFRVLLGNTGVSPAELDTAADRVADGLLSFVEDSRARWILTPHPEHRSEYEITGWLDGRLVASRIDRTFVAEGVRWIIDYKTSEHKGGRIEAFLENEKMRYRDQLERYARVLALTESRPIRVGLYFPLLRRWIEWSPVTAS
jgi:ATP-dependent exoDNAse (exonuclease V) beta subunit